MNKSGSKRHLLVVAGGALLVLTVLLVVTNRPATKPSDETRPGATPAPTRSERVDSPWSSTAETAALDQRIASRVRSDWNDLLASASSATDSPEAWKSRLHTLRDDWLDLDPTALATTIGRLLAQDLDSPLPLPFEVGPGGTLVSWPTLRVFLLDVLASSDPETAATIARQILATTDSAEEFAVALRPLARNKISRASDAELLGHLDSLLGRREWHDARLPGAAEALDLTAAIATADAADRLANWLEGDPPTADAGWLAIHEVAAHHPAPVIDVLVDHDRLSGQSRHRAQLFARADPADPAQMADIGAYLADPSTTPQEITEFTSLFPFRSATVGYRLYSSGGSPYSREEIIEGDRLALQSAETWLSTAPPDREPALRTLRDRLAGSATGNR